MKHAESKVTASDCSFCPANTPKPEDMEFKMTLSKEKQQIISSERLEMPNIFLTTG